MKLLLIDNESFVVNVLASHFKKENWTIDFIQDYNSAKKALLKRKYDIVICDYDLGEGEEKTGLNLIKELRKEGLLTPVILLTGRSLDEITPWDALEGGFDDFIKKPYEPKELKARIFAIFRRKFDEGGVNSIISFKGLELDLLKRKVSLDGISLKLGNTIFLILVKLLENKGKIVSYEELIDYIWGEPSLYISQYSSTLRVHITHLKKILGKDFSKNINTIHGLGYILEDMDG